MIGGRFSSKLQAVICKLINSHTMSIEICGEQVYNYSARL